MTKIRILFNLIKSPTLPFNKVFDEFIFLLIEISTLLINLPSTCVFRKPKIVIYIKKRLRDLKINEAE